MIGRLIATFVLIAANGFFVASEFALIAVRRSQVDRLAEDGKRSALSLQRSLREVSLMLAGAQLGITIASLLLGFVAEPVFAEIIESIFAATPWTVSPAIVHIVAFIIALAIVVFLHMVFGEMVPKNFSISEPERTALAIAIPFRVYAAIFRVVIVALSALSNAGTRLLGAEPVDEMSEVHSSAEIMAMLGESRREGEVADTEHSLLSAALSFGDRDAEAAMTPRTDLVAVDVSVVTGEIERLIRTEGKSRIPVCSGDLDDVLGFVHAKDLLEIEDATRELPLDRALIRDFLVVPEQAKLLDVLSTLRAAHAACALVVDEHGGTAGMLTLEDILEEIVGDIRDEYDLHEFKCWTLGPGRYLVDGSLRPHEVAAETGLELPEGNFETLGGFIFEQVGDIPGLDDLVDFDGWLLRVRTMDGFRVARVEIVAPPEPAVSEPTAD